MLDRPLRDLTSVPVSLLEEIQADAVGDGTALSVVLRKCQVLAARLDHAPLRDWARSEIEGYTDTTDLPEYRKTGRLEAYGSFMRGGVQYFPKLPIPRANIPQESHERLFAHQFLQGVAQLEPLAAADPETSFSVAWPNDAIALYGSRIYEDMVCLEAYVPITPHIIRGVLDTVRNRVLTFALEIWKEDPAAGEASSAGAAEVPSERVDQIFNTYILGPTAAVSIGGGAIHQTVDVTVTPGDIDSLRAALTRLGVTGSEIAELEEALTDDAAAGDSDGLGPSTSSWIQRLETKARGQSATLASGVTSGLLTELILHFLS